MLIAALALGGMACKRDGIDVIQEDDGGGDFGRAALLEAVQLAGKNPKSPEAFRRFADTVTRLRPQFNEAIEEVAERNLAFLALGPLQAQATAPLKKQRDSLALTVWPTAFAVEPKEGEGAREFTTRLCDSEMKTECGHVVPEHQPLVLSARAWQRMEDRAREAYAECRSCRDKPAYEEILTDYDRHVSGVAARLAEAEDRIKHEAWPEAGEHGREPAEAPLLSINRDGEARFEGEAVEDVRGAIKKGREGRKLLGVHLWPGDRVQVARQLVADAGKAGYEAVALQARSRDYPYPVFEYRLATKRRGAIAVRARNADTIQVLVRALDRAAGKAEAGEDAVFTLSR